MRRLLAVSLCVLSIACLGPQDADAGGRTAERAKRVVARRVAPAARVVRKVPRAALKALRPAPVRGRRVVVGPRANPLRSLPPTSGERFVFGVMGGAGTRTPARVQSLVFQLGGHIAKSGHVTLTGASGGLPDDAVRGARSRGGLTVGISPYQTMEAHQAAGAPTDFDVLQLTKLPPALEGKNEPNYMGREIDNIERSDAIIVVGGRFGTLGELAIALEHGRPLGVLTGTGGIAEIVKDIVAASTRAGKPPLAPVIYDSNPQRLVTRLATATRAFKAAGGVSAPIGDR